MDDGEQQRGRTAMSESTQHRNGRECKNGIEIWEIRVIKVVMPICTKLPLSGGGY